MTAADPMYRLRRAAGGTRHVGRVLAFCTETRPGMEQLKAEIADDGYTPPPPKDAPRPSAKPTSPKRRSRKTHRLDVCTTSALLAALGGFAEDTTGHSLGHGLYTDADIELMRRFQDKYMLPTGKMEYGRQQRLAAILGRDRASLAVVMSQMRKRGALPPITQAARGEQGRWK